MTKIPFKAKYVHVYYRIDSEYKYGEVYSHGPHFPSEESKKAFYNEVIGILESHGWTTHEPSFSHCSHIGQGNQELYLHPQSFSGVVEIYNVNLIESWLKQGKTFECYHVDVYEDIYDISDEEYMAWLTENSAEIKESLLEAFKTKRSNLYIPSYNYDSLQHKVDTQYKLERLPGQKKNFEKIFVNKCFLELVEAGEIIKGNTKSGTAYRTATKKDKKEAKVS